MTRPPENLEAALRAAAAGELDALTPEQVAALEDALNREPGVAERLGACVPALDERLEATVTRLSQVDAPSAIAWERAWLRVDQAATRAGKWRGDARAGVWFRLWKPLAAAAACVLLVLTWRLGSPATEAWPVRLATSVEIESLEVYDGATPFVIQSGGENAVSVIWMLPDQG